MPTARLQAGIALRIWVSSLPSTATHSFGLCFKTAGNNHQALIWMTPTGQISWGNTVGGGTTLQNFFSEVTTVETSGALAITPGSWVHFEAFYDSATGDYELRIEGVTILSGNDPSGDSGVETGIFEFLDKVSDDSGGTTNWWIKDLVVWDGEGTQNNDFVGPVQVIALPVNADVSSGWTPSTGTSDYQMLDELTPNDADYIEADETPPAPSIMEFEDLPVEIIGVRALMTVVRTLKTDGGDATAQVSLRYNAADDDGSDDAVQISAIYHWDVSELNPDTGLLWAPTEVDDAQIVINRTS
jgi:hypothetical protein